MRRPIVSVAVAGLQAPLSRMAHITSTSSVDTPVYAPDTLAPTSGWVLIKRDHGLATVRSLSADSSARMTSASRPGRRRCRVSAWSGSIGAVRRSCPMRAAQCVPAATPAPASTTPAPRPRTCSELWCDKGHVCCEMRAPGYIGTQGARFVPRAMIAPICYGDVAGGWHGVHHECAGRRSDGRRHIA